MKRSLSAAFSFASIALCFAQSARPLPKFEDFRISEAWTGPSPKIRLESEPERLFRTQLREAAKKAADFAGHYRFVEWGCGTRCAGGALIDLQSGKVFSPPAAANGSREEKWIFCTDWDKLDRAEYHVDSRLFVLRCGHHYGEHQDDVQYFVWQGKRFKRIVVVPGKQQ